MMGVRLRTLEEVVTDDQQQFSWRITVQDADAGEKVEKRETPTPREEWRN